MPDKAVWELQPYDTETGYNYFTRFYLPQSQPRTLQEAYVKHLIEVKNVPEETAKKRKPSKLWRQWFYATDKQNNRLKDSLTWEERAAAYDRYKMGLRSQQVTEDAQTSQDLIIREQQDYELQLKAWELMFNAFTRHLEYLEKHGDGEDDIPYDPSRFTTKLQHLVNLRNQISTQGRRALEMPDKYGERKEEERDVSVSIEWKEPDFADDDIGIEDVDDNDTWDD